QILKSLRARFLPDVMQATVNELGFQGGKESFHHGVISAIVGTAHRAPVDQPVLIRWSIHIGCFDLNGPGDRSTRVVRATLSLMLSALTRSYVIPPWLSGLPDAKHHNEVGPTLACAGVGDTSGPLLIWPRGGRFSSQDVCPHHQGSLPAGWRQVCRRRRLRSP